MLDPATETILLTEQLKKRSHSLQEQTLNRTVEVLAAKRARFREELQQLIVHLGLLVPLTGSINQDTQVLLLQEAVHRLGDEAFAQFLLEILQEM